MRPFRVILVVVFVVLLSPWAESAKKSSMSFVLSFDKEEYKKSDSMKMTFALKNEGKKGVMINSRFEVGIKDEEKRNREVYLIVTGPDGSSPKAYEARHSVGLPRTTYFVTLKAKGERSGNRNPSLNSYFDIKKAGKYEIKAVYENSYGKEIGVNAFAGPVESAPVTIEVTE